MRKKQPSARQPQQAADTGLQLSLNQKLKLAEKKARENNLAGMRDSILDWGKTLLSNNPPNSLKQLAERLSDEDLVLAFEQLDRQLYQGEATTDHIDFKQLFQQLRAASSRAVTKTKNNTKGQHLHPLYPSGEPLP